MHNQIFGFSEMEVVVFSVGKTSSSMNEDAAVATKHLLAVIDGATGKIDPPLDYGGRSGGAFLADLAAKFLSDYGRTALNGREMVRKLTEHTALTFRRMGFHETFDCRPEARPSASLAIAHLDGGVLEIVQLGDVSVRINGATLLGNRRLIDDVHAERRREAIRAALKADPGLRKHQLLELGRAAISASLLDQVRVYQNTRTTPYGHGVLDGQAVPEEYVKIHRFPCQEVRILEIFSDGYPKIPIETKLEAWERAYEEAVAEDPYRLGRYPGTKAFPDDRTIIIAQDRSS